MGDRDWGTAGGSNIVTTVNYTPGQYLGNPRGRQTAGSFMGQTTIDSAINNFYVAFSSGRDDAKQIVNALVGSGLVSANKANDFSTLASAYSQALTATSRMIAGGQKDANVFQGMQLLAAGNQTGGSGQGGTHKSYVTYSDAQAKKLAIDSYKAILDTVPSEQEITAFTKALRAGAKAAPAVTKTSASGKTTTSQAGFDVQAFVAGFMATKIPDVSGDLDGVAGEVQNLINQYKSNYGINPTKSFVQNAITSIVGSTDPNSAKSNLEQQMKEQAQILFPALSDKINAGLTVRAIADPFISTYSRLMEVNDMNVGLDNQDIVKALSSKNEKGEYQVMDTDSFARSIRSKAEWADTRNAKETMLSAADNILKQFGFKGA